MEEVAETAVSVNDGKMEIVLDAPFDYTDGNLKVGFSLVSTGSWKSLDWYGVSLTKASIYRYSSSSSSVSFLPKMTITSLPQSEAAKLKVEAETAYDFGFLTAASEDNTATFTLKNQGNVDLTDATVAYNGDAAISLSSTGTLEAIEPKATKDITITVSTTTPGIYAGTITVTGTGSEQVVIPVMAVVRNSEKLFVDFDAANPAPTSWTTTGWTVSTADGYASASTEASIVTDEVVSSGENLVLRFKGTSTEAALTVYTAATSGDGAEWTEVNTVAGGAAYISTDAWQMATYEIPATAKYVKITASNLQLDAFYGLQMPAVPAMVMTQTDYAFGLVSNADAQALTFTVRNEGGAPLQNFSVTSTNAAFQITDAEGNALPTSIAAGTTLTVKVKMAGAGQQEGTITVKGDGVDEKTFAVSGYMLDDTKIVETFASLPDRWSASSGWTYNATTGAMVKSAAHTLITPKIVVAEGEVLAINARLRDNNGYVKIEGSADGGESWTAFEAQTFNYSNGGLNTSSFVLFTVSGIPAGTYNLRLTGYDVYINAFNGFHYASDPVFAVFSNEACTTAQASPATKNFGFIAEAQSQSYYLKNTGNGQIDLSLNQVPGFTASLESETLAEGVSTTLTITMPATEGLHDGTIVVTAKNHGTDAELGTFTVNANGAVAGQKNDVNFAQLTELPAGWETTGWTVTANSYVGVGYTSYDLTTATLTATEGETLLIEAKGNSSYYEPTLRYSYKVGDGEWTQPAAIEGVAYSDWKIFAISGIPAGDVKVKFSGNYTNIRRVYGFEAKVEPYLVFTAADKNFGMITADATTEAYTITNSGAGELTKLSVTCDNDNFTVAVADNATSIAANGGTATFTVTLKADAKGLQTGTVTVSGDGVENKTFKVSGYVADKTKIFETFATLPDRWENNGWNFSEANGAGATTYSVVTMESPKIKVSKGEKLAISAKLAYSGSYYVTINGSSDNGATWTAYTKKLSNDVLNNSTYTVVEIDDIPTTVNKLQLVGYYVYVNGFNGFTTDDNDPKFALYSDAECTQAITAATATNNWGFVSEAKTATYYIKNTGTGTMTLTATAAPAGFTATLGNTALGAGESTTLTISADLGQEGYHTGNVVLTATDSEQNTLGTFTVTTTCAVVGQKTDVNFANLTDFPAGWEADNNWTVSNGKATISYNNGTITTGTYTVAQGESMIVEARRNSSSSYATISLNYQYSIDGGTTWSQAKAITPASTSYELLTISDIPAGEAVIKFSGTYVDIQRIYGYSAVQKANIALDKTADYDFGMQTADADYVITVTNNGTAEMTGLTATVNTSDYTVAVSKTTLAVGEKATVTVTQKYDASKGLASLAGVLTITADGLAGKTINLSGKTRDAAKWYVDFADNTIPASFVETGSWKVSSSGAAYSDSNAETSLISQPIDLAAGEKIQFDAKKPSYGSPSLQVRYSVNGGISWSDYVDYASEISSSAYSSHEVDLGNAGAVTAIVEFKGYYYMYLDNIYGGTLNNDAPMIAVTKGSTAVNNGVTETFGAIKAEATATYTLTNVGHGTLTITEPVAVTGGATATISSTGLTHDQSATLTITMPVAAPYGEKKGTVTVATSLGNFIVKYTATILNPNALDEQFANGKPAGWYFGGQWNTASAQAVNDDGTISDLITEQLHVAGPTDALTFQAKNYSTKTAAVWTVAYSADRINWTNVDVSQYTLSNSSWETITVDGIAEGDYYLRIKANRLYVDNFLGWEKKNNEHDLYVTATSFPTATQTIGSTVSVSATVTSLIANEEGVYAKLFIDGKVAKNTETVEEQEQEVEVAATAANVALRGSQTFTMSYTLPATPGTYKAQIKVYYSNGTVAFTTAENDITVDYPSLTLDEESERSLEAGTYNVTLSRIFAQGWTTVCLPFDYSPAQLATDAKAYAFTGYSNGELSFGKVETMEAGKPYIVYMPKTISEDIEIGTIEIKAAQPTTVTFGDATFTGTYAPMDAGTMQGKYGVTGAGKIAKAGENAWMNGFRAYFDLPAESGARLAFYDEATGIARVMNVKELNSDAYNLKGQRVESLKKGNLYIVGGKKVMVK